VLAVIYAIAIPRLLRTQVPGGLVLHPIDLHRYFSPHQLARASNFETFVRVDALLGLLAPVAALGVYARRGPALVRESAAGRIGTGMLLAMLGFAVVWLAQLPFAIAQLWWERRYHVSHDGYVGFVIGNWIALGASFLFVCAAILIVMGLAAPLRRSWWIAATPVFVAFVALQAFVTPYLVPEQHPLRDRSLVQTAARLKQAENVPGVPIDVQSVRRFTTEANAAAAGFGPTRRVIIWDTLLGGRFTRPQVAAVLGHELGHLKRGHILKHIAWYALFALPIALAVALATRQRGGMYEPTSVPLALLVLVIFQLAALPLRNTVQRRYEAEADWISLQATRDPDAARGLFANLAITGHAQPQPPGWSQLLFDEHPSIAARIAMADAWQRMHALAR
jgi:STE24 endopeptidase